MTEQARDTQRLPRKRKLKRPRRIALILLVVGSFGFLIGLGMWSISYMYGNDSIRTLGTAYVACSVGILAVRQLLVQGYRMRRSRYSKYR